MKKTRSLKSRDTVPLSEEGTLKITNNIPCAKGGHDPLKSIVSFVSRNVGRHVQKNILCTSKQYAFEKTKNYDKSHISFPVQYRQGQTYLFKGPGSLL
jgi:hypothetical protein